MVDIVLGKNNDPFGYKLAMALGVGYFDFQTTYYPDGENAPQTKAPYETLEGKHVAVVYRREQRPDRNQVARHQTNLLDQAATMTDANVFGAERLDIVMPYFLEGRQDHNPRTDTDTSVQSRDAGKGVGYMNFVRALHGVGADSIVTFNPHFYRGREGIYTIEWQRKGREDGQLPVACLSAIPMLAEHAKNRIHEDALVMGPDGSAGSMVREFADIVDREMGVFEDKVRTSGDEVHYIGGDMDMGGRPVVFVDDIFSTFGTIQKSIERLKKPGEIDVYGVHAVLPPQGYDAAQAMTRPDGPIRELVATDTIISTWDRVSVMDRLVEFFKKGLIESQTP